MGDPRALRKSGFDSGKQSDRVRVASPRRPVPRAQSSRPNPNAIRTGSSLESIVSNTNSQRIRPSRPQIRPAPSRPVEPSPPRSVPSRSQPSIPSRLTISSPKPLPNTIEESPFAPEIPERPSRLQVLTDRPNLRNTFPRRPEPASTEEPETTRPRFSPSSRFSTAGRPKFNSPQTTKAAPTTTTPPAPLPNKAAPQSPLPTGEEYYYYYYYYDEDEEGAEGDDDEKSKSKSS